MKKIVQFSIFLLLTLSFGTIANAQSSNFYDKWIFDEINGVKQNHDVFIEMRIKSPDIERIGLALLYPGDPFSEEVKQDVFPNLYKTTHPDLGKYDVGKFFVTNVSNNKLDVTINYGYEDTDGDERIHFDAVTYSTGRFKETETVETSLNRTDVSYDCNFVQQNCRVYQTYSFKVKCDSALIGTRYYDRVNFIIARFYKDSKIAFTLVLPYTIEGKTKQYLSTGPGPYELYNIVRAAPGSQSKTYMSESSSTSSEVTIGSEQSNSNTNSISASVTTGFSAGPLSASATVEVEKSVTNTAVKGKENTYNLAFTSTKTYYNDNAGNGDFSDLFIVGRRNYEFGIGYDLDARREVNQVVIHAKGELLFYPLDLIKVYPYTEKQLLNEIIPQLKDSLRHADAKYWELLIYKNDSIKKAVIANYKYKEAFPLPASGQNDETVYEKSESLTLSQEISIEESESITVSAEGSIGASSASVSASTSWTVSTTSSSANTNGQGSSITTGYELKDDDIGGEDGDKLDIEIYVDPTTGTPIWNLVESASKTSCPYEGGFQMDQPEIWVLDPITQKEEKIAKFSDIPVGEERSFQLILKNRNTEEERSYQLSIPNKKNKPSISSEDDLTNDFVLSAGESRDDITLTVTNKGSEAKGYKDFLVIFGPECDPSLADTVLLSAFFGATDLNRAPDNDLVENAFLLTSDGSLQSSYSLPSINSTLNYTTKNATTSPEEQALIPTTDCYWGWCAENNDLPEITNSVWFKFVATSPSIEISLCDSANLGFNSQMAVFSASNINDFNSFTPIAANDDYSYGDNPYGSRLLLEDLNLGDTLYVLVDGFMADTSDFSIRVTPTPSLADDYCGIRIDYNDIGKTLHGFNVGATVQENEQLLIPASTNPVTGWKEDSIQHSVYYNFTIPEEGNVDIDISNATFDTQISVYQGSVCEPYAVGQWTHVAANDDPSYLGGGLNSRIELRSYPKYSQFKILVDGYKGAVGTFDIKLSIPAPINDEPCAAILLELDEQGQGAFGNGGATASEAEQALAPVYGSNGTPDTWSDKDNSSFSRKIERSVWFKFVAPSGGAVEISTCDMANFQLQMALYKVEDCNSLNTFTLLMAEDNSQFCQLPPDNDHPNGSNKRGSILQVENLTPDATYYLMVDGSINTFGTFNISLTTTPSAPPVNDDACNAIDLPTNGVVQTGFTTMGATKTSNREYLIIPQKIWKDQSIAHSVWFTFTAPSTGEAEISTCDRANFDTQLAVYSVTDCANFDTFTLLGANEDGPRNCATNGDSFLPLKGLTAGQKYYLVVDAFGYNPGNFNISISDQITPGPANDEVANAIELPVNGKVQRGFTNLYATVSENEQSIRPFQFGQQDCINGWCDEQVDNSVWFKFVAPADGKAYISTCDLADFDTQLALYEVGDVNDYNTFILIGANDAGPYDCATYFDSFLPVENLTPGKTYYILVDGFDADNGNFDITLSNSLDYLAPSVPSNLSATNITHNSFAISWSASTDNIGVENYTIYLDGITVGTVNSTTYTFTGLTDTTTYIVEIIADDAAGNRSDFSPKIEVATILEPDTEAPNSPTNIEATNITSSGFSISWSASSDNIGVSAYHVYFSGELIETVTALSTAFSGLSDGTNYSITIVAEDEAGNTSQASTAYEVSTLTIPDTSAPSIPTNLTASNMTGSSLKISWDESTDNVGVVVYTIYLFGELVASSASTTYTLTGLNASSMYAIYVVAYDAAGNASKVSKTIFASTTDETTDTTAPTSPANLQLTGSTENSLTISWDASSDAFGVTAYHIYLFGEELGSTNETSFTISALEAATNYAISITASDAAGNVSEASATFYAKTQVKQADTTAPTSPTNLKANDVTASSISLSWDASSDDTGVAEYMVYLFGELTETTTSTAVELSELNAETTYAISVKAKDAAGNISNESSTLYATTLAKSNTAVRELEANEQFRIYPNPFTNVVNLEMDAEAPKLERVEVLDVSGRIILRISSNQLASKSLALDLSAFPSELYFLSIQTNEGMVYKKIMKQ
ncbi:MAG: fibronectin type III domain-containing protein [Prolixibacteraceae bacterium]